MAKELPKKTVHRKSTDGRFTTQDYAKRHPATTEKERVPARPPSRKPSK